MKRNIPALGARSFDLCVIGAGVVGACVARDAARRGLSVALIDCGDFAAAASEAMSRTIHGGIRYLATGRLALIKTGLKEQAIWSRIAPDFIAKQDWLMPHQGGHSGLRNQLGVFAYQWMAGRRAVSLGRGEAVAREPVLSDGRIRGVCVYQDYHLADPHRLVIALVQDAVLHGAEVANHVEAAELVVKDSKVAAVRACDNLTGELVEIRCRQALNATGPWAQSLLDKLLPSQQQVRVQASKGIHIVVPAFTSSALALSARGEHGFVVPWHGMSLVGTSDTPYRNDPAEADATPADLSELRAKIARLLPSAESHLDIVLDAFAGVRALPGSVSDTYRASREELWADHASDGASGFMTLTGGKWTTARLMAEHAVDRFAAASGKSTGPCDTRTALVDRHALAETLDLALCQARDREMAVTPQDYRRRLGRHRFLVERNLQGLVDRWLEHNSLKGETDAGREGRQR